MENNKFLLDRIQKRHPELTKEELFKEALDWLKEQHFSAQEWEEVKEDLLDRIFAIRD